MIHWPESLVEEIASKRVIIFIGAGVSASAKKVSFDSTGVESIEYMPTWNNLLLGAAENLIRHDQETYTLSQELVEKGRLLDAAEVIFSNVSPAESSRYLNSKLAQPGFEPSELHQHIQAINAKVVITTNYDQLYERQCGALEAGQGYAVRKYDDRDLLDQVRSKNNVIIKAHGCASYVGDIIITRSDYFKIKSNHSQFYNVLNGLLTVNTVLFLGCSMNDPDIQLVLENTNIATPSSHSHYAVMCEGNHPSLKTAMKNSYNIEVLEYQRDEGGGHGNLAAELEDLCGRIEQIRPRMLS